MNTTYGMQFGSQDAIHDPTYSTNQNRLQTNLFNSLGKQYAVPTVPAGTAFSVNLGASQTDTEQLFTVTHGLNYTPQTYVFFFLTPNNGAANSYPGFYQEQFGFSYSDDLADYISYSINNDTLTVNHTTESYGYSSGSYTSPASSYNLTIKYIICNNTFIRTVTLS